jgi:adenylate cyclase
LKKNTLGLWIFSCLIFLILTLSYLRTFNSFELSTYDLRFKIRPPLAASSGIVLIEIADDTLKNLGKWPLPRDFHASLVGVLKEYGARAVVFDILFSESTLYDEIFSKSVKEAGNIYFPLAFYLPSLLSSDYFGVSSDKILSGLCPALEDYASGTGQINTFVDSDGKVRRIPLFIRYNNTLFPNLGLLVASRLLGLDSSKVEFKKGRVVIDAKLSLPVGPNTTFLVNYPDKWQKSFLHLSYFELLKSYSDIKKGLVPKIDLSILKNKVCFVGLTATGTSDLRATPLENIYPMLGLQASVFNSLSQGKFIYDIGALANTVINIVVFLLCFIICARFRPLGSFLLNLAMAAAYFCGAVVLFITKGWWVDLFFPLLIIFLSYAGSLFYRFLDELRKRELIEKELDIARSIQDSFLPQELKEFCGIRISAFMQPAKFVAGDLYDIVVIDDKKLGILIGDVSGKGVPAALIMAQTISLFRVFSRQYPGCPEVLKRINSELCGKFSGRFVTALYMLIDTQKNTVQVSSAGHAPLLHFIGSQAKIQEIELSQDMPLGIMEAAEYQEVIFNLGKQDKLIVFTDGVQEARNKKGEEFGIDNAKKIITDNPRLDPDELSGLIKEDLLRFSRSCPQHDDITLIVVDKRG